MLEDADSRNGTFLNPIMAGDHPDLGRRQFASRMAMYLILRAIGDLTPATNPQYARDFASAWSTRA